MVITIKAFTGYATVAFSAERCAVLAAHHIPFLVHHRDTEWHPSFKCLDALS